MQRFAVYVADLLKHLIREVLLCIPISAIISFFVWFVVDVLLTKNSNFLTIWKMVYLVSLIIKFTVLICRATLLLFYSIYYSSKFKIALNDMLSSIIDFKWMEEKDWIEMTYEEFHTWFDKKKDENILHLYAEKIANSVMKNVKITIR